MLRWCLQESEAKDELIDVLTKENDALRVALQKLDNMAGDKGRLEGLQQQDDTLRRALMRSTAKTWMQRTLGNENAKPPNARSPAPWGKKGGGTTPKKGWTPPPKPQTTTTAAVPGKKPQVSGSVRPWGRDGPRRRKG